MQSLKTIQYQKLRELNPLRLPLSEYALQYKWKAPGEPSPLMLAENQLQQQKHDPLQNINNDKVVPRYEVVFVSGVYCRYSQEYVCMHEYTYVHTYVNIVYIHTETCVLTYLSVCIQTCNAYEHTYV